MFYLLSPIIAMLMKSSFFNVIGSIKKHIICWVLVVIAAIFALLFLNIALYIALSVKFGAIYAALIVFTMWILVGGGAILWANSAYKHVKNNNTHQIEHFNCKQREYLMPLAISLLPIIKRRKKIIATTGVIILGGIVTAISKFTHKHKH